MRTVVNAADYEFRTGREAYKIKLLPDCLVSGVVLCSHDLRVVAVTEEGEMLFVANNREVRFDNRYVGFSELQFTCAKDGSIAVNIEVVDANVPLDVTPVEIQTDVRDPFRASIRQMVEEYLAAKGIAIDLGGDDDDDDDDLSFLDDLDELDYASPHEEMDEDELEDPPPPPDPPPPTPVPSDPPPEPPT